MGAEGTAFSLVIPAHNEARNLEILIPEIFYELGKLSIPFEVIAVDNDSTDNTKRTLEILAQSHPQLRTIVERERGLGNALRSGFACSSGTVLAYMCSDNQVSPADLAKLIVEFNAKKCDFLKAVRMNRACDGSLRIAASVAFNTIFRFLLGIRMHDIGASPKLFSRRFYELARFESKGWLIELEIVLKAQHLLANITEVHIPYHARRFGSSNLRLKDGFDILKGLLQWCARRYTNRLVI